MGANDLAIISLLQCLHALDEGDADAQDRPAALVEAHRIASELIGMGGGSLGAHKAMQIKAALESELAEHAGRA